MTINLKSAANDNLYGVIIRKKQRTLIDQSRNGLNEQIELEQV
jgi:hypothetical protein